MKKLFSFGALMLLLTCQVSFAETVACEDEAIDAAMDLYMKTATMSRADYVGQIDKELSKDEKSVTYEIYVTDIHSGHDITAYVVQMDRATCKAVSVN